MGSGADTGAGTGVAPGPRPQLPAGVGVEAPVLLTPPSLLPNPSTSPAPSGATKSLQPYVSAGEIAVELEIIPHTTVEKPSTATIRGEIDPSTVIQMPPSRTTQPQVINLTQQ